MPPVNYDAPIRPAHSPSRFSFGGLHDQKYNPLAARTYSSMMLIAVISPGSLGSSIA